MSAISNFYGFYPPGTGPQIPSNIDESLLLPPIHNISKPNIGIFP
jgi:hypothetical protein